MSSKSTSNGIESIYTATDEQLKSFQLQKHLVSLLWDEPFYSRILRSLNKVESDKIPTAGVLQEDSTLTLWWNRSFLASLTDKQVKGLLKHECLHLVFKHTTDRRKDPHLLWNYATDLAINSIIPKEELPEGGLIPGVPLPTLTQEQIDKMTDKQANAYIELSNVIASFPVNKTSEYYFQNLINNDKIKEYAEDAEGGGSCVFGFDDHEGWESMSDESKELMSEKVKQILEDAVNESKGKGWGSLPSETIKTILEMVSNEIRWEDILKRFCGFTRRDDRTTSIKRLNRKYPGIHPGVKKLYKPRIAVYVDESGSMSNDDLQKFFGELNSLSKQTDFYLYKFDTRVNDKEGFLWKKGKRMVISRTKHGGTNFETVTKHALKNKKNFDGYIIFTDGCAPKPKPSHGLKRCWLILPQYKLYFDKDRADILIQMK